MSIDARIVSALSPLGLPIENCVYDGSRKKYITFNCETRGDCFADDVPNADMYFCQVHLFAPLNENINALISSIKNLLLGEGFTWPETTNVTDENGRHIVFEFREFEALEWQ